MSDIDYGKLKEFADQWNAQQKEHTSAHPCPACGHCPTCGRGGYGTYPYYPRPYPYITWGPSWEVPMGTGTVTYSIT
jgi:hypothetical protein